jgi:hypothetical protein
MNWDFIGTVINWAVLIAGVVLAVYNFRNAATRNKFLNGLDKSDTIQKLNETLDLAADRNLKYEKQRSQDRDEIFLLEKRLAALESNLQYRLTFDVILGTDPSIEKANIKHLVERRESEHPVNYDRRKKL